MLKVLRTWSCLSLLPGLVTLMGEVDYGSSRDCGNLIEFLLTNVSKVDL